MINRVSKEHTMVEPISKDVLSQLAPNGVIRAAINLGNPVLAQRSQTAGGLTGASVDLARELGRQLDVPVTLLPFESAAKVFEAVTVNAWDIAFLASDPARAAEILFMSPYVVVKGTYIVRDGSPFRSIEEFDRPGLRIAAGRGAAYDLFLTRSLKYSELVKADTSAKALDLVFAGGVDAAAGVRQLLAEYSRTRQGMRVIEGRFTAIEQAMATPKGRIAGHRYLQLFIEAMKANGFVADALKRSGQLDVKVAPSRTSE